ncbi:MAG: hypothetical protein LQ338_000101 [Usnochroma carphineum]|nr:MAG: hypothetical protein LQ338_000101 [Usnochroma carphineum]
MSVNADTVMEDSNPTAEANSKTQTDLPSSNDVDKAIAEVEARRKPEKLSSEEVAVETNGHEASEKKTDPITAQKSEPSERVKEGQRWNNRDRHGQPGRPGAKDSKKPWKENYKSDLTSQEESSDPVAIRKQVEFYFSDSNLLQDEFLFNKVQGHENLPVPISTIHSFRRMRHFQPFSAVVDALKESSTLNVVGGEIDHVQRKIPLPEGLKDKPMIEVMKVFEDEAMKRSVYVKGFGEEQPSTQFDIEAFFAEFGPTNSVRLRRLYNKLFKGSVFVEFDSEKSQKKFLELDPKPKWKGEDLIIKSKKQYCDDKIEDIKAGRIKPKTAEEKRLAEGKGGDERDWRVRREEDLRNGHRRGGGGRGFGSHKGGRGRGGRDGGNRRGRDDRRKQDRDDRNVPKVATTAGSDKEDSTAPTKTNDAPSPPPVQDSQATAGAPAAQLPPDSMSKEHAGDDGAGIEDATSAKEVDSKPVDVATSTSEEPRETPQKRAREEENEPVEGKATKKVAIGAAES